MKKQFGLLAGMALVMCASCSDGVQIENPPIPNRTIEFSNFVENGTRASKAAGYTFDVDENIGVYGFENDGSAETQIFNNQKVTNTAGNSSAEWTYSPKKYWNTGNTYEFYAAYPYEQPFVFSNSSKMFSLDNFVVSDNIDEQIDLMIAERNYTTPNNTVQLVFHHILSNVNFYAKVASSIDPEEITSVDIVSLDVNGLLHRGSYEQTGWKSNHESEGNWKTKVQDSHDYFDFPNIGKGGQSQALALDKVTNLATDMLMVPQKLFYTGTDAKGDSARFDPTIDVEFKVSYSDNTSQTFKRSLRLSSIKSYIKKTLQADGTYKTEDVADPIYEWRPNYKYNYVLTFNPAKTTRIWDADSDGGIDSDPDNPNREDPEKGGGSRYNPDKPNEIEVWEDKNGDGKKDDDEWTTYPVVWEDIDGDGNLEAGVDKDGDGHIDNVDGDKDSNHGGNDTYDPTDGDDVNNPDGKDVILVYVDTDGDGEPDDWRQLEKDPETGEIMPGKDTLENYIEFTAIVADWEVEYGDADSDIDYEITK